MVVILSHVNAVTSFYVMMLVSELEVMMNVR